MRTKPCLTSADVKKMMAACMAEAAKNNWKVTVAIVDDGGFMLHLDRMDGAAVTTAEVAVGKARTAALTRRPSKDFEDRVKERPAFISFPAGLFIQGALPIMRAQKSGHIINLGSLNSENARGAPTTVAYNVAKTGLIVLSK